MEKYILVVALIITSCKKDDTSNVNFDTDSYITKSNLQLPFPDEYYVFWGGRTVAQNYHRESKSQRYAMDVVIVKDFVSHKDPGEINEDYYCFGKDLQAPAGGIIYSVENSIKDNAPGIVNNDALYGNYVIIDHENGEFSHILHFKQGSIVVEVGERVEKGQKLGEVGNSGRSTEPHIHYHMQDSPTPFSGSGLPTQFQDYYADGEYIERGEPVLI